MVTRNQIAAALLTVWRDRQQRSVAATPEQHCIAMADEVMRVLREREQRITLTTRCPCGREQQRW